MNRRTDGERGVRRIVLKKRKMVEKRGNPHTTREPLIILFARTLSLLTLITLTSLPSLPSLHPLTLPYTSLPASPSSPLHLLTLPTLTFVHFRTPPYPPKPPYPHYPLCPPYTSLPPPQRVSWEEVTSGKPACRANVEASRGASTRRQTGCYWCG